MKSLGIIITGASGYIGSKLTEQLPPESVLILDRNSLKNNKIIFYDLNGLVEENIESKFNQFVFVHLATHFSKKEEDFKKIKNANIDFGVNLLEKLGHLNLKKIIYTNTMFTYYRDKKSRNFYYTKSKNHFSEILDKFCENNNYLFDEIYLDNTFGGIDERKKILPLIKNSILCKEPSPILDPNANINLLYVDDVILRIKKSIFDDTSGKFSFVNKRAVNLTSIYNFLNHFYNSKVVEKDKLIFNENQYINNFPKNEHFDFNITNLSDGLIKYLSETNNH